MTITDHVPDPVALAQVFGGSRLLHLPGDVFRGASRRSSGAMRGTRRWWRGCGGHTHGGLQWDVSGGFRAARGRLLHRQHGECVAGSRVPPTPSTRGVYTQQELSAKRRPELHGQRRGQPRGAAPSFRGRVLRDRDRRDGVLGDRSPLPRRGSARGRTGFPGFSDIAAGGWHRTNYAGLRRPGGQGRATTRWTLGDGRARGALRGTSGPLRTGRWAGRYELADALAVRGERQHRLPGADAGAAETPSNVSHPSFDRELQELVKQRHHPVDVAGGGVQGGRAAGTPRDR